MVEEKREEQVTVVGEQPTVSDETGQLDARFVLWRCFCTENSISVDTLPSELSGEAKERWEKIKDNELHKPIEAGKGTGSVTAG